MAGIPNKRTTIPAERVRAWANELSPDAIRPNWLAAAAAAETRAGTHSHNAVRGKAVQPGPVIDIRPNASAA